MSKTKKEKQETKNQQAAAEAADGNLSVEPVSNEDEDCDDSDYETEPPQRHNSTPNSGAANSRQVGSVIIISPSKAVGGNQNWTPKFQAPNPGLGVS